MSRSILITGASSGIGEALAREFSRRGYRLALLARRVEVLRALQAELQQLGAGALHLQELDVTDTATILPALHLARDALGGLDIIVANAGIGRTRALGRGDFDDDRAVFATNIDGACATLDAGLRLLRESGGGQLVGISSVARLRALPGAAAYSASKAALHSYLQGLRLEVHGEPIAISEIAPGYIDTPINRSARWRPFVISAERGARLIADRIEAARAYSTVPAWPWVLIGPLLRLLPPAVLARQLRS